MGERTPSRYAADPGFNPFLVRASVYWLDDGSVVWDRFHLFQSLLSQGISLLLAIHVPVSASEPRAVSIPS